MCRGENFAGHWASALGISCLSHDDFSHGSFCLPRACSNGSTGRLTPVGEQFRKTQNNGNEVTSKDYRDAEEEPQGGDGPHVQMSESVSLVSLLVPFLRGLKRRLRKRETTQHGGLHSKDDKARRRTSRETRANEREQGEQRGGN